MAVAQITVCTAQDNLVKVDSAKRSGKEGALLGPSTTATGKVLSPRVAAMSSLRAALKESYEPELIPGNVTVQMHITLVCAIMYSDTTHLSTTAQERFMWTDERLSWNPADYEGIKAIVLNQMSVWLPDIKISPSYARSQWRNGPSVKVFSSGRVYWITDTRYYTPVSSCSNVTTGDEQAFNCSLELDSWMYTADELSLQVSKYGGIHVNQGDGSSVEVCPYKIEKAKARIQTTNLGVGSFQSYEASYIVSKNTV